MGLKSLKFQLTDLSLLQLLQAQLQRIIQATIQQLAWFEFAWCPIQAQANASLPILEANTGCSMLFLVLRGRNVGLNTTNTMSCQLHRFRNNCPSLVKFKDDVAQGPRSRKREWPYHRESCCAMCFLEGWSSFRFTSTEVQNLPAVQQCVNTG